MRPILSNALCDVLMIPNATMLVSGLGRRKLTPSGGAIAPPNADSCPSASHFR
jgi:hypothetical protein